MKQQRLLVIAPKEAGVRGPGPDPAGVAVSSRSSRSPRRRRSPAHARAAVLAAIADGRLEPGGRYSVAQLAEQLGISRTPVREALLVLEREGRVRFERNRGVRILETTAADVAEVFELRLLLEVPAAAKACGAVDTGDALAGGARRGRRRALPRADPARRRQPPAGRDRRRPARGARPGRARRAGGDPPSTARSSTRWRPATPTARPRRCATTCAAPPSFAGATRG